MNPDVSDEHLVIAAQNGDRGAFLTLYHRYLKKVYNRVRSRIPEHDAEDITQEIFIAVVHSLDKFQRRSSFSTWLYTIVNRQVADYYRRYYRKGDHVADSLEDDGGHTVKAEDTGIDNFIMLQQALQKLAEHYQEIILMRFADGLTFAEIAEQSNESLEAVKSRYRRAIQALRDSISEQD